MAISKGMGNVLLYDNGENGTTLRCRRVAGDEVGEIAVLGDLDEDQPIVFSGRFDFAYTDDSEEGE